MTSLETPGCDDVVVSLGGVDVVVCDLLHTLVHPGEFPGNGGRTTWLADLLGIDERVLKTSWDSFEPLLCDVPPRRVHPGDEAALTCSAGTTP